MLETTPIRKNKINLSDYHFEQDIYNRMLMSNFTPFDFQVLGEILFSPLKLSLKKLTRSVGCQESQILPILQSLSKGGLLSLNEDNILVDKEMRKYFEFQITKFDPHFKPDMEFLQGLLRKVPIHHLPAWHAIPRSSNNIFESIVEKYLLSPHIFQRYLDELHFANPVIKLIISDLFSSPDFKIPSSDLITKYNLIRRDFEEILLLLEFSFVCCLAYEKEEDHWIEYVVPFHEWQEYLRFLKRTEAPSLNCPETQIVRKYKRDFAFIEDMTTILERAEKGSFPLHAWKKLPFSEDYFHYLLEKICLVKLGENLDGSLHLLEQAEEWFQMSLESRSLYLYRHPSNRILNPNLSLQVATERNIREAEKTIKRVLKSGWFLFDDFFKGILVPLNEDSVISLKKTGKHWRYTLPSYGENEKALVKATLLEWLFETGMTIPGTYQGQDCFSVTPFGKFFFDE